MKNRVNLYQPSMRPKSETVNLTLVLICYLVAAVLISGWSLYSNAQQEQWQAVAITEKGKLEDIRQRLRKITAAVDTQPDKKLLQQAQRLQQQIQAQQYLLGRLGKEQAAEHGSYAELMLALAQQHQRDIWLTQIAVTDGRLQLHGRSLSAESVPRWLKNLSNSEYFIGTEFGSVKVFRDEKDQLNFVLGTTELTADKEVKKRP